MLKSLAEHFKEHFIGWVFASVFAIVGLIAWTHERTITKLERDMETQRESTDSLKSEVSKLRRSLIGAVITDPKQAKLIEGLVSDVSFKKGVDDFGRGNFAEAFAAWKSSPDQEANFALLAADSALRRRIADPSTPDDMRAKMQEAILSPVEVTGIRAGIENEPSEPR